MRRASSTMPIARETPAQKPRGLERSSEMSCCSSASCGPEGAQEGEGDSENSADRDEGRREESNAGERETPRSEGEDRLHAEQAEEASVPVDEGEAGDKEDEGDTGNNDVDGEKVNPRGDSRAGLRRPLQISLLFSSPEGCGVDGAAEGEERAGVEREGEDGERREVKDEEEIRAAKGKAWPGDAREKLGRPRERNGRRTGCVSRVDEGCPRLDEGWRTASEPRGPRRVS